MGPPDVTASIYNAAYMVRHYSRGGRWSSSSKQAALRRDAIRQFGLVLRDALNHSEDFEPLLIAAFDGLNQRDGPPF